jgi:hypothetical protein
MIVCECSSATSLSSAEAKELVPARPWGDHLVTHAERWQRVQARQKRHAALLRHVSELRMTTRRWKRAETRAQSQLVGTQKCRVLHVLAIRLAHPTRSFSPLLEPELTHRVTICSWHCVAQYELAIRTLAGCSVCLMPRCLTDVLLMKWNMFRAQPRESCSRSASVRCLCPISTLSRGQLPER